MILRIVLILGALTLFGGFLYWQLVIVEGVYLGQGVVTYLYDMTARRYDSIKAYQPEMEDLYLGQPLAEMLSDLEKPSILDIGTGTGRLPLALFEQSAFNGEVIGIDASRPMLVQGQAKLEAFEDRYIAIWKNAASLPFPKHVFDVVACLEMSEFTADPAEQLREGIHVLRPGGVFLTSRRRGMDAKLMPGKTFEASEFADLLYSLDLTDVRIESWQVDYDLVWARKAGILHGPSSNIRESIQCAICDRQALNWQSTKVVCTYCKTEYDFEDRILDMHSEKRRAK